jgi:hypothetical protein
MSGYAGNMNHLYGQNMMYGGMNGMSGMGSYGYPYNRINSAAYVGRSPFLYSPFDSFAAAKKAKKA